MSKIKVSVAAGDLTIADLAKRFSSNLFARYAGIAELTARLFPNGWLCQRPIMATTTVSDDGGAYNRS